jgi:hypothetical protein
MDKKQSKFYVPEPKWQPEKVSTKNVLIGLGIILIACGCASYAQRGIDGSGELSFVGFIVMIIIGFAVASGLQKLYSDVFGK